MQQHLRDSLRFMFQDPQCDYTQLLKAASAVEIESERGRALGLHSKSSNLLEDEKTSTHNSRVASPIATSVASMESKLEQLTTIVKSAQKTAGQGWELPETQLRRVEAKLLLLQDHSIKGRSHSDVGDVVDGVILRESANHRETSNGRS